MCHQIETTSFAVVVAGVADPGDRGLETQDTEVSDLGYSSAPRYNKARPELGHHRVGRRVPAATERTTRHRDASTHLGPLDPIIVAGVADPGDRGLEAQSTGVSDPGYNGDLGCVSDPGYNRTSFHLEGERALAP